MSRSRILIWLIATLLTAIVGTTIYLESTDQLNVIAQVAQIGAFANEQVEIEPVIIYSAMPEDQVVEYVSAFRTKYPTIPVTYEVMDATELVDRIVDEKSAPQADVIWGLSATVLQQLFWNDILTPYSPAGLGRLPDRLRDSEDPPAWVGQYVWMSAFCVNVDMLGDANLPVPRSWEALFDPMYEEMIYMPDPRASGTGYMTLLVFVELFGENKLWKMLDELDNNVAQYLTDPEDGCVAVVEEEIPIAVSYGLAGVLQRATNGSVLVVFPEEGSGWEMEASALVRQVPVKDNAKIVMDFIISDEAMHHYGQHYAITSVPVSYLRPPIGFPEEPIDQLMEKDFLWVAANRNRLSRLWGARYER